MDSVRRTSSDAKPTQKSSTTSPTPLDNLRNASYALVPKLSAAVRGQDLHQGNTVDIGSVDLIKGATLLARGGYNFVFLIELHQGILIEGTSGPTNDEGGPEVPRRIDKFVLRLPCADALVPYQVANEVAFKRFVALKLPHIPVPHVFLFEATHHHETCFIVEEFIDSPPLSSIWMSFTPVQKEAMALMLASVTVDLAEVQFEMICGLDPLDFSPAPTVEGPKLFKGRQKFHRPECYPIGPYRSTKEYVLACYDREIYYYTHAAEEDIDADLFEDVPVHEFVNRLREKREAISSEQMIDEPFVLVHDDLHGRNILTRGDQIAAVLDWEFAGSYPLSETLSSGDITVVEPDTEALEEENEAWGRQIRAFIRQEVERRGWSQEKVDLLMGDGNRELGIARTEMFP